MRRFLWILIAVCLPALLGFWLNAEQAAPNEEPRYTAKNQMAKPANYREWVWLSSGFGMSYREGSNIAGDPPFDNVFVSPAAYRSFMQTGEWPDKTVMVLEVRESVSRASINKGGHFQGGQIGMEVHVKDSNRFPGKWAFFGFDGKSETGTLIPTSASCYSCHEQNGAVDTTFVQFYPTLLEVAKRKGTLKANYEGQR